MSALGRRLFGKPRDLRDPKIFHHVSLIAFFAWVGLGADGLSSSAYGPEEAFKNLNGHTEFAIFLALATAFTVFIISYAYSRVIEHFPHGGGGYLVATKLLGEKAGVVSGCALLVDYVLTISISVAAGADAVFALLPHEAMPFKFATEIAVIGLLVIMNLRGIKESVQILTPIFIVFVVTHVVLILGAIIPHLGNAGGIAHSVGHQLAVDIHGDKASGIHPMGFVAMFLLFARAYSLGGGTYTGIEAVSNGIPIMREPRVQTGKRTMVYMATSLALTAGGIIIAYLLLGIHKTGDEPMNATLAKAFAGSWHLGGVAIGKSFVVVTMVAEGALLFVAAQTGFIDGPRVMSNMALDSWIPHQFAALSDRLTMRNGVYLMGGAAIGVLVYTHGKVDVLAVMYSINVFLTFSLSELGMSKFWISERKKDPKWKKHLSVHMTGLTLCGTILIITVFEKFAEGGWVTLIATMVTIIVCYFVRSHYRMVGRKVARLNEELGPLLSEEPDPGVPAPNTSEMDPMLPTAVLLAGGYSGLGVHTLVQIDRLFPGQFKQVVFISVGVIDSGTFKGVDEMDALRLSVEQQLAKYVVFARTKLGWASDSEMVVGTEAVAEIVWLCRDVHLRFPRSMFFAGKLIFKEPSWWDRLLHNETARAVQHRLEFEGLPMIVLPVRMLKA
jgi:amino acid transporter